PCPGTLGCPAGGATRHGLPSAPKCRPWGGASAAAAAAPALCVAAQTPGRRPAFKALCRSTANWFCSAFESSHQSRIFSCREWAAPDGRPAPIVGGNNCHNFEILEELRPICYEPHIDAYSFCDSLRKFKLRRKPLPYQLGF